MNGSYAAVNQTIQIVPIQSSRIENSIETRANVYKLYLCVAESQFYIYMGANVVDTRRYIKIVDDFWIFLEKSSKSLSIASANKREGPE